jgi:hypothetical protein
MKIALIFSGAPRIHLNVVERIKQNFIRGYDVDIFSYTWKINDYDKVSCVYDNFKQLELLDPSLYDDCVKTEYHIHEQFMCQQIAARIFCQYVESQCIQYDYIIRTRHDIFPYHKVHYSMLDPKKYYVAVNHWPENPIICSDNLLITGYNNYKFIFYDIYEWVKNYAPVKTQNYVPEIVLSKYLMHKRIFWELETVSMLNYTLPTILGYAPYDNLTWRNV